MIATSRENFTNAEEQSAWQQGYQAAFERQRSETQFERYLKESVRDTVSLVGIDSRTLKDVREVYENSNWTERQKYAFMSGLLNGLSEAANLDRDTLQ